MSQLVFNIGTLLIFSDLLVWMDTLIFWIQYRHGSETTLAIASLTFVNADIVSIVHRPA